MADKEEIIRSLTSHYSSQVMRAFGNIDPASKAIEVIAKSLNEIYRYFEPSFFKGEFYVCKNLDDKLCYESNGTLLYDKNILLNRVTGIIIIQVFNDSSKMILWDDQNPDDLLTQNDTLVYYFANNKEYFYANGKKIDITICNYGSRFATQFNDLVEALNQYWLLKILKSSCEHFSQSWYDAGNRIFFKGGGSGSNIPEKYMQISLHEFLTSFFIRGISMESSREYNSIGDFKKPKPVDIRINWREANRTALIEVKFIGTVKKLSDGKIYSYSDAKANSGITQLKGYHDAVSSDIPTTLIKSYLVVIDGRRNNLTETQTEINTEDGLHFKDIDLIIDADRRFHETIQGFEKPIRMFVEPICI